MSDPNVFLATIVYEDKTGERRSISAVVVAVDEQDAINAAVEAVQSLPHCATVLGGMLEAAEEPKRAEEPQRAEPIARSIAGQTVH